MTASLSGLTIGSLTLTPEFDPDVKQYTATTSNATNKVTATAADGADVTIMLGETEMENGTAATWADGENTLTVTVAEDGKTDGVYTVTVTKS